MFNNKNKTILRVATEWFLFSAFMATLGLWYGDPTNKQVAQFIGSVFTPVAFGSGVIVVLELVFYFWDKIMYNSDSETKKEQFDVHP